MPRAVVTLLFAGFLVLAAIASTFLFIASVVAGDVGNGLLWLGDGLVAIVVALYLVAARGSSDEEDAP
jgi:hypothetical protein